MASDPFQIFKNAPGKHRTLKALWPELYDALAGPAVPEAERVYACVIGTCSKLKPPRRAVARLSRWGHPACAVHVKAHAERPGGWPLNTKGESS